jgi:hypothetical protein
MYFSLAASEKLLQIGRRRRNSNAFWRLPMKLGRTAMKHLIYCAAATFALLAVPAAAQDKPTLDPNQITVATKRPPLQLDDRQRTTIQDALATENTEQKVPPKFEARVGDTLPLAMSLDVMPARLVAREPSLQPYGYAKLPNEVLVIDPMNKTIIAILPRQSPTTGKDLPPADWAATRGRELTGQAPEPPAAKNEAPEPAGDAGDRSNGTEHNANEK